MSSQLHVQILSTLLQLVSIWPHICPLSGYCLSLSLKSGSSNLGHVQSCVYFCSPPRNILYYFCWHVDCNKYIFIHVSFVKSIHTYFLFIIHYVHLTEQELDLWWQFPLKSSHGRSTWLKMKVSLKVKWKMSLVAIVLAVFSKHVVFILQVEII